MSEKNIPQEEVGKIEVPDSVPVADGYDPALENIRERRTFRQFLRDAPSIAFSLAVHGAALLLLGLFSLPVIIDSVTDLVALPEDMVELEEIEQYETEPPVELNVNPDEVSMDVVTDPVDVPVEEQPPQYEVATTDLHNLIEAPKSMVTAMGNMHGEFGARRGRGGPGSNEASERAVGQGLKWIADHQLPNGAWVYTQMMNPNCRGKCADSPLDKYNKSVISATAMAMLPMLGAGITHKDGEYRRSVRDGLDYITKHMQAKVQDGVPVLILAEPGASYELYHHGLATIVLCEAAAMTRDRNLENYAQGAVNYISWAQDPVGGGWRYAARTPGDTSSLGWNLMALKSAQMGYLEVHPLTISRVRHFLNNVVGMEGGALYGYTDNGPENGRRGALTAVGLLCQMYLGWKAEHPALSKGTDYLAEWGPQARNLYYSYYATQVMHHVGGEKWENWNKKMRDDLVAAQIVNDSHERGSWPLQTSEHLEQGGRLTATAFATMILEVYYRHLPLFRRTSTAESFPLDD